MAEMRDVQREGCFELVRMKQAFGRVKGNVCARRRGGLAYVAGERELTASRLRTSSSISLAEMARGAFSLLGFGPGFAIGDCCRDRRRGAVGCLRIGGGTEGMELVVGFGRGGMSRSVGGGIGGCYC